MTASAPMPSPEEYGRQLAQQAPPLTDEQVEKAARILASIPAQADAGQGDHAA